MYSLSPSVKGPRPDHLPVSSHQPASAQSLTTSRRAARILSLGPRSWKKRYPSSLICRRSAGGLVSRLLDGVKLFISAGYHTVMANSLPVESVGVSHVAGKYNFTDDDFLNEGAAALHELGCGVIKVWFTPTPEKSYPFNSNWPKVNSLVELATTPYFKKFFEHPFATVILETFAPGR